MPRVPARLIGATGPLAAFALQFGPWSVVSVVLAVWQHRRQWKKGKPVPAEEEVDF